MMNTPDTEKASLRRHYTALRDALDPALRQEASQAIYDRLFALDIWQNATQICAYMSIRGEIDTLPIIRKALADGKSVALPCTTTGADEGQMVFRQLTLPMKQLEVGRFGIPEPPQTCPTLAVSQMQNTVMLLPALAFDRLGYRLGYGGGYYDRYLAQAKEQSISLLGVGLVFDELVADTLPHHPHDIPAHLIITQRRIDWPYGQA